MRRLQGEPDRRIQLQRPRILPLVLREADVCDGREPDRKCAPPAGRAETVGADVPVSVRRRLAMDGTLLGTLTRIFVETVHAFYAEKGGKSQGLRA